VDGDRPELGALERLWRGQRLFIDFIETPTAAGLGRRRVQDVARPSLPDSSVQQGTAL